MKNSVPAVYSYLFFLIISCFYWNDALSQDFQKDLLAIDLMKKDTSRVEAVLKFFDTYCQYSDTLDKTGVPLMLDAFYLSKKLEYNRGIMESSYRLGGKLLQLRGLDKSVDFYFIALKKAEESENMQMQGRALMGIGLAFYDQKKWSEALDYFEKSKSILKLINEQKKVYTLSYLIGLCMNELKNYPEAKRYLLDALNKASLVTDSNRYYECTMGLAYSDYGMQNYDSAISKYDKAMAYYKRTNEVVPLEWIHYGKARVFFDTGKLNHALTESLMAYNYGISTSYTMKLEEITTLLYSIYQKIGDKENAIKYLVENKAIRDSLNKISLSDQLVIASYNYKLDKKEAEYKLEMQKSNRRKNLALFASVIFGLIILFIIYAYQVLRRERKKSEELLLNILPEETASELKLRGTAIPKYHPSVSIMFMDVVNFTTLSSGMTAETLVNILDFYFRRIDEIITNNGLEKIKTIGDAYMCASGLHHKDESKGHAESAICAAIEIMRFAHSEADAIKAQFGYSFNFRIGIDSGSVVSGVVGSKKYAYDIWGDSVNTAARMEQTSEPNQINISSHTYQQVEGKFPIIYRGKINAKHKGELDMYFVDWR